MNDTMDDTTAAGRSYYDIVILGAGYAGLMAALRLGGRKGRSRRIALVNGEDQFVERVRLQENISMPVAARIPSIAKLLTGTGIDFICGNVAALDANARHVRILTAPLQRDIRFDQAIYTLGSRTDVETVPGVEAQAYRLDPGDGPRAAAALRATLNDNAGRPLRVVVVGGGATAIEAAGEIKARWRQADVTIMSSGRCGDFKGPRIERALRSELRHVGVRMLDHETVAEVSPTGIITAAGETVAYDLCVWSGGLRASPIAREAGLSTDPRGRIFTDPLLRSISHPHIFAAGDAAHPIAPTGAPYRMSAFAALTSGAYVADVVVSQHAADQQPFSFSTYGQGISIGRRGVGFPAFPDDRQRFFVIAGASGYHTRNFFVWLITYLLKRERTHPGSFSWIWPGQRRVSWQQANDAMQRMRQIQPA